MASRISRLRPSNSVLFVCDIEKKYSKTIKYFSEIVEVTKRMIDAARILGMQTLATEEFTKDPTNLVPELGIKQGGDIPIIEKHKFSMCVEPVLPYIKDAKAVIICGIEAHACVLQTALDLLERKTPVHVICDAVSSRSMVDRKYAFKEMERAGAILTTSETAILALVGGSDHPKFEEIKKIILTPAPYTGLCTL